MLQNLIITVVALPLALGVVVAIAASLSAGRKSVALALLAPLLAAVILIGIDGLPAFPPVRAAHKLPYVLAVGGVVLAALALLARGRPAWLAAPVTLAGLAIPAWWMGRNILANNSQKLTVTIILVLMATAAVAWISTRRQGGEAVTNNILPQAVFATSLASSMVAILGGYMGMAMFNGALAAFAGGYLLVTYIAWLRGNSAAFSLGGTGGLAFAWVAYTGLLTTALLAPKASAAALVVTGLTLVLVPFAFYTRRLAGVPHAIRPLVCGLAAAIPALAGILIAALQFAG